MARLALDLRFFRAATGGLGRYSRNLLSELLKIDQVNEYTAIITSEDEPEFSLRSPNLRKEILSVGHYSLKEQTVLKTFLNSQSFDLVHFANFNHPILYRRPFVVTIHDLIMHLYPSGSQKNSWLRRIAYKTVINDCRRAARIIVPSRSTRDDLVKILKFPEPKIAITPEGSEPGFRLHSDQEKRAIRKKFQLPQRYLLFVSRWEAYKGLPTLLEAHQRLNKDFPDLALVICGRPDKQNPQVAGLVEAAKRQSQKIITPGFVSDEDLAAIYAAASVYVHPSWYEGFGIMILEAFGAGVPVVTSHNSSLPEVVGNAGLLVNPQDPNDIAAKIRRILLDEKLASLLRRRGLQRVKQYSWAKMAKQTLAIYQEVLGLA